MREPVTAVPGRLREAAKGGGGKQHEDMPVAVAPGSGSSVRDFCHMVVCPPAPSLPLPANAPRASNLTRRAYKFCLPLSSMVFSPYTSGPDKCLGRSSDNLVSN
eukprot:1158433-Pelagomonas_calceolata.AAC.17